MSIIQSLADALENDVYRRVSKEYGLQTYYVTRQVKQHCRHRNSKQKPASLFLQRRGSMSLIGHMRFRKLVMVLAVAQPEVVSGRAHCKKNNHSVVDDENEERYEQRY